ncbi:hypothetical protein TcBrA4_0110240 [Trypanosoma cruzi]|nr:hypothetical protein TcBrA4_0110240 [Trypanosoma cruzi]
MRRQMYTREELIALREALALDTFADPVPLDCPMRTDSDLTLHQTTVRKRNKEDWKVKSFSKRISAFNGTIGENNVHDTTPTSTERILGRHQSRCAGQIGLRNIRIVMIAAAKVIMAASTPDTLCYHRSHAQTL